MTGCATHSHRGQLLRRQLRASLHGQAAAYGSLRAQGRRVDRGARTSPATGLIWCRPCEPTGRAKRAPDDRLRKANPESRKTLDCFVAALLAMTGLAVIRHARACPGHPRSWCKRVRKAWMAGSSPAMTTVLRRLCVRFDLDDDLPGRHLLAFGDI